MSEPAILLANGHYRTVFAKTSHGLVRGPSRYDVVAVVDPTCSGVDAGELLDGRPRGIPVVDSVGEALDCGDAPPKHCVIGVATEGGVIPPDLRADLVAAAEAGLGLVNGLHQLLSDDEELVRLVRQNGGEIVDLRAPRPTRELRFWTGEIMRLRTPRLAVLGTDCAVGKRTTCKLLEAECRRRGVHAETVYTGQTGWLQGGKHGFILDSTPNDFVSGELEGAILACQAAEDPGLILIEGQSALRNPSGPCGSELILSGGARAVVLQHSPTRREFEGFEGVGCEIGSVEDEIELVRLYGADVWAVTLNTAGLSEERSLAERDRLRRRLELPVVRPLEDGIAELADVVIGRAIGEGAA